MGLLTQHLSVVDDRGAEVLFVTWQRDYPLIVVAKSPPLEHMVKTLSRDGIGDWEAMGQGVVRADSEKFMGMLALYVHRATRLRVDLRIELG